MFKFSVFVVLVATSSPALASETKADAFVPRLIAAIDDYMSAYQVCLVRTIAAYPAKGETPEQIASASIATCQKSDAAIKSATKRVQAFPSVANFMSGTSERIFAYSLMLAKARLAER